MGYAKCNLPRGGGGGGVMCTEVDAGGPVCSPGVGRGLPYKRGEDARREF